MEAYLNVAEWGDGIFGAEAASQARFGKSAADLTEREAALLAAVLPSPNKWRLDPPGPYVSKRAGMLQARMRVVASEGLAACVLDDKQVRRTAPKKPSMPSETQPETPAARPVMPDLPPVPEEGPEAVPPEEVVTESPDDFDSFLQDAQDTFQQGNGTPPETEDVPEPEGPPAAEAPDAGASTGPTDLRPRALEPDGAPE
jgi:monofunctional biosynthetic peptidoglycan transglycosylase